MKLSEKHVLILEDDMYKYSDIKKALDACGIHHVESADNQEEGFQIIYRCRSEDSPIDLIITDMNYPLGQYGVPVEDAGERLIARLKKEALDIPVIVCSSLRYSIPGILGCVWYNELCDLDKEFSKILDNEK